MDLVALKAMVLGIIQGLTEFLPVSSSGHLVIGQRLFGLTEPELLFDVILHVGTLTAVLIIFRKDVQALAMEALKLPGRLFRPGSLKEAYQTRLDFRLLVLIAVGFLPTAAVGIIIKIFFEFFFSSAVVVGLGLLFTGAVLFFTRFAGHHTRGLAEFGIRQALIIGLVQGMAVTPGISRSGITICAGLFLGLERNLAARYSFLLSIPVILAALVVEAGDGGGGVFNLFDISLGFATALVSGLAALVILLRIVRGGRLYYFSFYCWLIGLFSLGLAFF